MQGEDGSRTGRIPHTGAGHIGVLAQGRWALPPIPFLLPLVDVTSARIRLALRPVPS